MADKKISDLTAGDAPDGTELVEVEQGGNSRQLTTKQVGETAVKGIQHIPIPLGGAIPRETNGSTRKVVELATNDVMIAGQEFSASTQQACQVSFVAPKAVDVSQSISGTIHWTTTAATSGNCIWGVRARAAGNDDAMDGTWGTAVEVTDGYLAQGDNHIIAFSGLVPAGTWAAGDKIFVELYRKAADGSDTLNGTSIATDLILYVTVNAGNDA